MTTIVAIEGRGKVTIAADSRVTGSSINDGWVQKIVQNGDFTFAAAGHLRAIQVLEFAHLPQPPATNEDGAIVRFVSVELVPAIVTAFSTAKADDAKNQSVLLAIVRGRVYDIYGGDGAWVRSPRGLYALGSGSRYALGALEAGATAEQAIKIASLYDWGTNGTVTVKEVTA